MAAEGTFRDFVSRLPRGAGRVRVSAGPVTRIVIDAPSRKNALDPHMMVELADAARAAAGASIVLIRGEGAAFCSGGDLAAVRDHLARPGAGAQLGAFMADAIATLRSSGAFIVGAATGPALGGGAEILAACDLVFATPGATVGWVQARLGVSPGFGGGASLVARVGRRRALRLLVEATPMDALAAKEAGLIDEITDDAVAGAEAWIARAVELPPAALRGAVRVVRAPAATAAQEELAVFTELWGGPAHVAALATARGARRS